MFAQEQPRIAAALQGAPGLRKAILFAVATVRAPFAEVAAAMPYVLSGEKPSPRVWFGFKWYARDWLDYPGHLTRVWQQLRLVQLQNDGQMVPDAGLVILRSVPGLGLVKAGFVLQLLYGQSGCLDAHNINLYGLTPRDVRSPARNARPATIRRSANRYNRTICELGGSAALWDNWCHYVATEGYFIGSAEDASRLHLQALGVV